MRFTAKNNFHNTECSVEVRKTYLTNFGDMVAVMDLEELDRAAKRLCGIKECQCASVNTIVDHDDNEHIFVVRA